jgi:hypothetical protein
MPRRQTLFPKLHSKPQRVLQLVLRLILGLEMLVRLKKQLILTRLLENRLIP